MSEHTGWAFVRRLFVLFLYLFPTGVPAGVIVFIGEAILCEPKGSYGIVVL